MSTRTIVSSAFAVFLLVGLLVTINLYATPATAEITVKEVMCEQMCAPRLQVGLSKVTGVQKVVVSVKDQKIRISYDDAKISLKQLQEKIGDLGFTVTSK